MKYSFAKDQRGFGHLGIVLALVVVGVVGVAGWWVWQKNHSPASTVDTAVQNAIKNASCDYNDKDLCKFFTGWKVQKYYTVTSVNEADGQKTTTVVKTEGNKSHLKIDGAMPFEIITIDSVTYTKAGDGTWWKQTTKNETAEQLKEGVVTDLTDPGTASDLPAQENAYKKVGKEKCGDLTCFKYQDTKPSGTDGTMTTYMWFDDEEYQLRRTQTISPSGSYDATYSYTKVSIGVPSPVKELGPNQYLIPGQNQPTTLPATGDGAPTPEDLQRLMDQYQQ